MRIRRLPSIPRLGWPAWLATLVAFALLCASAAYWAMRLVAPRAPIAPPAALDEQRALPELRLAAQLFGVAAASGPGAALPSNVVVVGILAAGSRGSAILGVDGRPPKAFAVGERISATQQILEVRSGSVVIDAGGMRSELPAPIKPDLAILTDGRGRHQAETAAVPDSGTATPAAGAGRASAIGVAPVMPPPRLMIPPLPPPTPPQAPPPQAVPAPQSVPAPPPQQGLAPTR